MRGRTILAILVVAACALVAWLYISPAALSEVKQALGLQQASSTKSAGADAPATGNSGRGKGGATTVVAATASVSDFPIRRYAIGFLESPAVVNINPRVSSQVVSIAVKDGQMVKQGDLLFTLDDRALKAQVEKDKATLAKDQALLESAKADLARAKNLMDKQAGTQQAFDQALAAQKAAAATVDADQAAIDADMVQLSFTVIKAPISGRLGAINVTTGDLVNTSNGNSSSSTPMVTITEMDPLQVTFNMPEGDLRLLHQALQATGADDVTLRQDGNRTPIASGKLDFVDSSVDTASGTITARATVPNKDLKLWPGQYVTVVLQAGTMPHMVSVPTIAVQPSQKGSFVYVIKPDNKVEFRPVDVALTVGQNSAISKGLQSGERVVIEGQTRLKDGATVRIGEPAADDPSQKVAQDAPAGATQ